MFRRAKRAKLFMALPFGLRSFVLLVALFFGFGVSPVSAQQIAQGSAAEEKEKEEEKIRSTIDLGSFKVKDLRPTRNETASVTFKMYLALDLSVDERTAQQLEHWKHRLRDQVIVAIRLSETKDFLEPDLSRFRRYVLLRTNRVLKTPLISEALLTEYFFKIE